MGGLDSVAASQYLVGQEGGRKGRSLGHVSLHHKGSRQWRLQSLKLLADCIVARHLHDEGAFEKN